MLATPVDDDDRITAAVRSSTLQDGVMIASCDLPSLCDASLSRRPTIPCGGCRFRPGNAFAHQRPTDSSTKGCRPAPGRCDAASCCGAKNPAPDVVFPPVLCHNAGLPPPG